jgi:hypothetical protein
MLPEAWVAGVLLGDVATMDETDYQCGLLQKKIIYFFQQPFLFRWHLSNNRQSSNYFSVVLKNRETGL